MSLLLYGGQLSIEGICTSITELFSFRYTQFGMGDVIQGCLHEVTKSALYKYLCV